MDIRVGMEGESDQRLKRVIRENWVINPWGRSGKFLGLDEFMEELVRNLKDIYNSGSSETLHTFARDVTARNIVYFMRIKAEFRRSMGVKKRSGNHVKQDRSGDMLALVDCVISERVADFVKGRGMAGVDMVEPVNDLMELGGERMNDGEWWYEYLARSPECVQAMKTEGLSVNRGEVEEYVGDLFA